MNMLGTFNLGNWESVFISHGSFFSMFFLNKALAFCGH